VTPSGGHLDVDAMLAEAIDGLVPRKDKKLSIRLRPGWDQVARMSLRQWANGLCRDVRLAEKALDRATAAGAGDEGEEELELVAWRVDAGREKQHFLFALAFGVDGVRLDPSGKTPSWRPDIEDNLRRLKQLSKHSETATAFAATGRELAEHPFIRLRNQISHELAPIRGAPMKAGVMVIHIRRGSIFHDELMFLNPAGTNDLFSEGDLFTQALELATQGTDLLRRSAALLATLVAEHTFLEEPAEVYLDHDTGKWSHDPP
jgi:hypothetical protein